MQVIERILHMLRVKDCRHVCLFCEYYDMCKHVKSEKAAEEGKLAKAQFDERQRESRLSMLDNCKIVRLCWDDLRDPTKLDRKLKVAGVPRAC